MHCASVWLCPLCASKISERRRATLQAAVQGWQAQGGSVYLLTLTVPHLLGDDLRQMLRAMLSAWRSLTRQRPGIRLGRHIGLAGFVRALEVTYTAWHGWHPHIHALLFLKRDHSVWFLRDEYYHLWAGYCVAAGLPPPSQAHGVRVDDGSAAAAYLTSGNLDHWGLAGEMTKAHLKRSRQNHSFTPWDLLRIIAHAPRPADAEEAARLFGVYAAVFRGCRQLRHSTGLKALLGVADASDAELAAAREDSVDRLADVDPAHWLALARSQPGLRHIPELLGIAEYAPDRLFSFINPS